MIVTLRIKKIYFDQIFNLEKKIEYRNNTEFYQKLFNKEKKIKFLKLHYQGKRQLVAHVYRIRLIKRPKFLENSKVITTNKVFAIELRSVRMFKKQ